MTRSTPVFLLGFAAVCTFAACSSDNDPATPGAAGSRAAAGAPAGTAGTPAGTGGAPAGTAGTPAGTGGAPAGTAGAQATAGGAATAGAPASGGASGTAGAPAAAGAPAGGAGAPATGTFSPLCAGLTTAAGPAPTKGGDCTAADPQLCYKGCGPQNSGFKSETCTAGKYVEQSGCTFPPEGDYSCFKIPAAIDAACPTTTITASTPCTVTACTACTDATKHYFDSQMNLKTGYCVCPASTTGTSKWSCASDTAWPCPTGKGC